MTDQPPASQTPASQTPARRTPARKPAPAKTDATASKPATTRAPRTTAAKAPATAKAAAAKAPTAKTPATRTTAVNSAAKATPAKAPAAKPAAAKTGTTATTARRAATNTTTKAPAARAKAAPKTTANAATTETAATPAAVEATSTAVTPEVGAPAAAASAPAGWYPVSPGSAQQRYWDGSAWTQHFHDPATAAPAAGATTASTLVTPAPVALKAPEGTNPNTVWFWLTALSPVLAIGEAIATIFYFGALTQIITDYSSNLAAADSGLAFILSLLLGLLVTIASILFPILDWWTLGKRGVPRPFHWAWSLFALVVGSPLVYVIGRTVIAKRRTGRGLAPLWVFIGLEIVSIAVWIFVTAVFIVDLVNQFQALVGSSSFG